MSDTCREINAGALAALAFDAGVSLPNELSALIHIALDDMDTLDRAKFSANARHYIVPDRNGGVCEVCLAGGVMAARLGADSLSFFRLDFLAPDYVDVSRKIVAIDNARCGELNYALAGVAYGSRAREGEEFLEFKDRLGRELTAAQRAVVDRCRRAPVSFANFRDWREYDIFKKDMREMANDLESVGL